MRLDYDLIREILLKVEEIADGNRGVDTSSFIAVLFPDEDRQRIWYHLKYLRSARLIEPFYDELMVYDLSPAGHEYLNNIRTDSAWKHVKKEIQPLGSVALSVIAELAKKIALSKLGL